MLRQDPSVQEKWSRRPASNVQRISGLTSNDLSKKLDRFTYREFYSSTCKVFYFFGAVTDNCWFVYFQRSVFKSKIDSQFLFGIGIDFLMAFVKLFSHPFLWQVFLKAWQIQSKPFFCTFRERSSFFESCPKNVFEIYHLGVCSCNFIIGEFKQKFF